MKMQNLKTNLLLLCLALACTTIPQKAHAVVFIYHYVAERVFPEAYDPENPKHEPAESLLGVGCVLLEIPGFIAAASMTPPTPAVLLWALDQKSNSITPYDESISNRYPFLNSDPEVRAALTSLIMEKATVARTSLTEDNQSAAIPITEQEILDVIAPADFTPEQVEQLVKDLAIPAQ